MAQRGSIRGIKYTLYQSYCQTNINILCLCYTSQRFDAFDKDSTTDLYEEVLCEETVAEPLEWDDQVCERQREGHTRRALAAQNLHLRPSVQ